MKKIIKYVSGLILCTLIRFIRVFPNNDPIMGFALPFARKDKWWQAIAFPVLAMISFDIITAKVGLWTLGTAAVYGFISLLFYYFFKTQKKVNIWTYAKSSIVGVLIFDFLTGPIMSSFLFKMPFAVASIGQIPFTLMHLASAFTYTIIFVPVLDPDIHTNFHDSISKWASSFFLRV